ncbi:hypothetical protein ElyMa_003904700 [Elysia marginata]|uniref:Uncharacterized protein n=1 Tax=Elysia marginata TaxID=1093978 RepID=A0AAV4FPZ5_9GAST|nr:hypothetical protein ElyMa_003904700 [Elysia marginata]
MLILILFPFTSLSHHPASDSALMENQGSHSSESRFTRTARRLSMKRRSSGSKNMVSTSPAPPATPTSNSSPGMSTSNAITSTTAFLLPPTSDSPKTRHKSGSGDSPKLANDNNNSPGAAMVLDYTDMSSPKAKPRKSWIDSSPKIKHGKSRSSSPKLQKSKK